jgi:serine/threonine protein kinase
MGTVYRAQQPGAAREVAIKIAELSRLSPASRELVMQRFETEIHAAASIVHDHVVPIYDVGSVDGYPYYAMRIVEGGDLGSLSKAEPLEPKRAARYMLGIAQAIAGTHQLGILHRDIKPQNILLDLMSDRAMIMDFGLARLVQQDSELTQSGQVLGTPSFMPPEQILDSRNIDERADIYSLGGTLYQLLTGRPPFKSADVHDTLRQVLVDEVVSPRRLNGAVDLDLDTICLKCLEKEVAYRYASAIELVEELERYLQGRAIKARPTSSARKVLKWCQRNPALATSSGLAAVGVLLALVASLVGLSMVSREKSKVVWERDRYSASSSLALASLDELYVQITEEPLMLAPGIEPVRKQLLDNALTYYQRLLELDNESTQTRVERAFALSAAGNLCLELSKPATEAERYLQQAIDAIELLPESEQTAPFVLQTKSNALVGLGTAARGRNDLRGAANYFDRARELRQRWTEQEPSSTEAHRKFANASMNLGLVLSELGELPRAESLQIGAQSIRQTRLASDPANAKLRRDIAQADFNLAMLELGNSQPAEAVRRLNQASNEFRRLAQQTPTDSRLWRRLVTSLLYEADISVVLGGPGAHGEALVLIEEGLNDLRALLALSQGQAEQFLALAQLYQQGIETLIRMQELDAASTELLQLEAFVSQMESQSAAALTGSSLSTESDSSLALQPSTSANEENSPHHRFVAAPAWQAVKLTALRQGALIAVGKGPVDEALVQLASALAGYQAAVERGSLPPDLLRDLERMQELQRELSQIDAGTTEE